MTEKSFQKKLKKLLETDDILCPPPVLSEVQYKKLTEAIKSIPEIDEFIEDMILAHKKQDHDFDSEGSFHFCRMIAFSVAIGIHGRIRKHGISVAKDQLQDSIRNAVIYTFMRSMEEFYVTV